MPKRTSTLSIFPWTGGVITAIDPALLDPGQLTMGDNLISDYQVGRLRREGINYDWDDTPTFVVTTRASSGTTRTLTGTFSTTFIRVGDKLTFSGSSVAAYNGSLLTVLSVSATTLTYTGVGSLTETTAAETSIEINNKVVGGIDYWFGNEDSRAHYLVTVLDNGTIWRTLEGDRERIVDAGTPWTLPSGGLTVANLEVVNNLVVIAVSGPLNQMKYWDGNTANPVLDLPANLLLTSVSRASSGTTRTLVFSGNVTISNGDPIIILSGPAAYNGSYTLLSGSGTTTITYTASTSLTQGTTADTSITIGSRAPLALFIRYHLNRLFANDKRNLDRLHYCAGDDPFTWNGVADSGALDIGIGDGDPAGLTGIAPTFKGDLFVGKKTKLYRLVTATGDPDDLIVIKQSNGIGFLSHQAIAAVDQDDVFFVSDRGIHSLNTTNAYGDFVAAFVSSAIQKTFVEDWDASRRPYIKAAYFPELNSVAFAVSENSSFNNSLWLFNVPKKEWNRWPNIEAEAMIAAQDADRRRAYFGLLSGRLAKTLTGANVDTLENGSTASILSVAKSGYIFPDHRPDTIKGFKRVYVIFRAQGSYVITIKFKVDNYSEQAFAFTSSAANGVPLGTFVLGDDILGGSTNIAPYCLPVDGYGRGFTITVEQNDLNTALGVLGLMVEFEGAGDSAETRQGNDS